MRLIDADVLVEEMEKEIYRYWNEDGGGYYLAEDAIEEVKLAPTVDAEPVRHGKWQPMNERNEIYGDVYMCDNCGHGFIICENFNYCPKCGAKMDGD